MGNDNKNKQFSQNDSVKLAVVANDITYLRDSVDKIDQKISSNYVSKEEFDPIKRVVYGMVGLILIGVFGAIMALILK